MLEIRELYCGYGAGDVLQGISLAVERGEFLCLAGPNGCGKSTLLKAIARLLPFRGSITIEGRDSASFSRRELAVKLALLGQISPLYFPYTVTDTVAMGRYARSKGWFGGLTEEDKNAIENIFHVLKLNDLREKSINELSGGQLQRVFLARTLVQDPAVILLDEPTNHLDLKHQTELLDYLAEWVSLAEQEPWQGTPQSGRTVIAVLHDLNLARRYGKTAALMADGRIAARGPADMVFSGGQLKEVYGMDIKQFMKESFEKWK
jgi:iron complex transport system ATP-binding protein